MQNVCEVFLLSPWICVTYSLAYPYLYDFVKKIFSLIVNKSTPL